MPLDPAVCHAAVEARDRRYDGLFFTGVSSTGIYCRCVCPARVPKRENRSFHPSAAAAEREGYRPCLLCRPECAPGAAPIDATERLAHDAVKRIESGALEDGGIEALASDLGVTGRHLRRAVLDTFGAAPVEIAQTHRLLTAKRLLRDTSLSMAQVAFAAGFQSVRRFNALFQARYAMPPSRVRDRASSKQTSLTFTLAPRGAFDGAAPFAHFTLRGVARMERAAAPLVWARTFATDGHAGHLTLDLSGEAPQLTLSEGLVPAFRAVVAALRGALDLDANLDAINAFLAREGFAEEVRSDPAVRLPGGLDPFELAVRAVVGQQVTVKAATTIVARLVERFGAPIETGVAGLDRLFPTPQRLADATEAELASMGQPAARTATVQRLARAVAEGKLRLARGAVAVGRAGLAEIAGIGPWTLEYVAMRGLGDPDAFPLGDSALRAAFDGDLKRANESWRPWRAYAAARLWRRPAPPRKKAV